MGQVKKVAKKTHKTTTPLRVAQRRMLLCKMRWQHPASVVKHKFLKPEGLSSCAVWVFGRCACIELLKTYHTWHTAYMYIYVREIERLFCICMYFNEIDMDNATCQAHPFRPPPQTYKHMFLAPPSRTKLEHKKPDYTKLFEYI